LWDNFPDIQAQIAAAEEVLRKRNESGEYAELETALDTKTAMLKNIQTELRALSDERDTMSMQSEIHSKISLHKQQVCDFALFLSFLLLLQ
jgi:hypothetical protein